MSGRHEVKHQISLTDYYVLKSRLNAVMKRDSHVGADGMYRIRSLYFDSPEDSALREKLDGVKYRDKYRIRYYDLDTGFIRLEKKHKNGSIGTKESAPMTKQQVLQLIGGETEWMAESEHELIRELYRRMKQHGLRPRTIVEYMREPFVYEAGNVRVTLDSQIRTGLNSLDFFNEKLPTMLVKDDPIILEVKWDAYLPDIIRDVVQLKSRQASAYSKYAQCRGYDF